MAEEFIPLSVPNLAGNEKKYVDAAIDGNWVSTAGGYVTDFENAIARYVGLEEGHACACASGTAAIHLALLTLGVGAGDIVLAPTLTFMATVNPIRYQGATPVFFDCDDDMMISVAQVRSYLENECIYVGGKTLERSSKKVVRAAIAVHVFGNSGDLFELRALCKNYNVLLVEDAAESLGTKYTAGPLKGSFTGTNADIGIYSFNGNKIVTAGSGGIVVSRNKAYVERARYLSTQAKDDVVYFVHGEVGYNYRMSNIQAALALAQLEQLEGFIAVKKRNYERYNKNLTAAGLNALLPFNKDIRPNYWFYSFVLREGDAALRDELLRYLDAANIQSRPIWKLNHRQTPYRNERALSTKNAERFYDSVLNVPCSTNLELESVDRVCAVIAEFAKKREI